MDISIVNNIVSLEIGIGDDSRTVSKSLVREISLIRDKLVKIDIGDGLAGNIYLPLDDIVSPTYTDGEDLCQQLNDFLTETPVQLSNQVTQTYTMLGDVKQDVIDTLALLADVRYDVTDTLTLLTDLQLQASDIYAMLGDVKQEVLFQMPLVRDEADPAAIYCGYAPIGTPRSAAQWAILKILSQAGILSYQWVDGDRNFDNVWDDRATLNFL